MTDGLKRQLRAIQAHAPFIRTMKFGGYNFLTRHFGLRIDQDFLALRYLQPVGLALDIGGNWGQSVHALKYCAKPRQIVTFEPQAELAGRLTRAFAGDPSVQVEQLGLSDAAGSFRLYTPRYRNFLYDGLASIDRDEAANWLNPRRIAGYDPSLITIEEQEVVLKRLDDYGFAPDVVKMDVQGLEDAVVRGGEQTFRKYRPATIVEAPSTELIGFFASIGMGNFLYDGHKLTPHDGKWKNSLFLTGDQQARIDAAGRRS